MVRQKQIWKLCFQDSDQYINFYYANRYRESETVLLLEDKEICSMLTILPIKIIAPNGPRFNSAMLYAIATHPQYQKRGYASRLIAFTHQNLSEHKNMFSVLVPSNRELFDYYHQQGFQNGFYVREVRLTQDRVESFEFSNTSHCTILKISPSEYNKIRSEQLRGRFYVAYADDEIAYQQKLSQLSGADIFGLEIDGVQGCVTIERVNSAKVFIKELLIPDQFLTPVIQQVLQLWPAKEYLLRIPAFLGGKLEGVVRPFGMIRAIQNTDLEITAEDLGYLGFAFD